MFGIFGKDASTSARILRRPLCYSIIGPPAIRKSPRCRPRRASFAVDERRSVGWACPCGPTEPAPPYVLVRRLSTVRSDASMMSLVFATGWRAVEARHGYGEREVRKAGSFTPSPRAAVGGWGGGRLRRHRRSLERPPPPTPPHHPASLRYAGRGEGSAPRTRREPQGEREFTAIA
jgi:hypothetical protein